MPIKIDLQIIYTKLSDIRYYSIFRKLVSFNTFEYSRISGLVCKTRSYQAHKTFDLLCASSKSQDWNLTCKGSHIFLFEPRPQIYSKLL